MQVSGVILSGVALAVIGALPFGLVNLSVLDTSYRYGRRQAMKIAHGAAMVEILFGMLALVAGSIIMNFTSESRLAKILVIIIPAIAGIIFLLKKKKDQKKDIQQSAGFVRGAFLNLVSIQVLMYWLIAMTYFNAKHFTIEPHMFIFFGIGIWTGKMLVLWSYAVLSNFILSKSATIASNMNRIIGGVLLITAAVQFIK
jgi:threonine/homoserine/homoserine lactone efflux protein